MSGRILAMSDIHGNYLAMLDCFEQAKVKWGKDRVFILGDMIDWGPDSDKVLTYLKDKSDNYPDNVTILLGNHELLCISTYYSNPLALETWLHNQGGVTIRAIKRLGDNIWRPILEWLEGLPSEVEYNNYHFVHSMPSADAEKLTKGGTDPFTYLLHAGISKEVIDAVWCRMPKYYVFDEKVVVAGHTISDYYHEHAGKVYEDLAMNYINIDCGAKCIGKDDMKDLEHNLALVELGSDMPHVKNVWYSKFCE